MFLPVIELGVGQLGLLLGKEGNEFVIDFNG
jgi:hypothetical protein